MRHGLYAGIAAFVLALGLGAVSLAASSGTPASGGTLQFDVQFHDTILSAKTNALALGDRFILSDAVMSGGQQVGHNGGVCTVTDTAGELECTVTWSLPDGTIATQFLNTPPPQKDFAIVGGTGTYAGARGTGQLLEHGDQTGVVTFDLTD
jgi:hypothetical protein